MWITTPESIDRVFFEHRLEPVDNAVFNQPHKGPGQGERHHAHKTATSSHKQGVKGTYHDTPGIDVSSHEWSSRGGHQTSSSRSILRNMPVVSIGQPETWPLQHLSPPSELPPPIQLKLTEADFYLVRLSCSFRPVHQESRVEWARFRAALLPHTSVPGQPIAFDLYPQQVVQEVKRPIKVTLTPQLKFQELEASVGSAEFGFEYSELIPLVSAAIGASFDPSWDYRAGPGQEVQGTKWMYLLVKAPKGMTLGRAQLELEADVLVKGARLPVTIWRREEQAPDPLTVTLWGT